MKVSFTGTQNGLTDFQRTELIKRLKELDVTEFINGDCIGADAEATVIAAAECGILVYHLFPSTLGTKRAHNFSEIQDDGEFHNWKFNESTNFIIKKEIPRAPLNRNKDIVDAGDILIACPKEMEHTLRSGTWATIRYAWHKKKKVIIIPPISRNDSGE